MSRTVKEADSVVIIDDRGNRIPMIIKDEIQKIKGLGVYNPKELIGKDFYERIEIGGRKFMIFAPSIYDKISAMERKAQIILPKDGMFIVFYCDIKSGDRVVEGGAGSGALTILLANSVRPKGRVISYEKREDFIKIAKKNLVSAGLNDFVEFKRGDVTETINEKEVDSVVLDIPNPWDALNNAIAVLKLGGHIACYSPTVNQVEKTVKEMKDLGLEGVKTLETMQREMVVGDRGTRPSFDTLGHTGYVTIGRKVK
ncbi:MAG: tRNA (adenine-N1)-methyltransferase [Thermoplasmata archaeon]|nr:MAG: tRNA (adenine-N1)-methyltransferase [Thermoplasmata archaeon]